jgi:hypothetical protein
MGLGTEFALVDVGSVSRDQFPKARRQGRWFMHDAVREACEMGGYLGAKREQMPDLPVFLCGTPGGLDQIKVRAWLRIILNLGQKHPLHFHSRLGLGGMQVGLLAE